MNKSYIRLNDNDNHLSIGNIFRVIKELSKNRASALQSEIFCVLFNIDFINETTVNNYCVGCRGIGNDYKQKFLNLLNKYSKDNTVFCDSIINILSIIDGVIYSGINNKIKFINENESASLLLSKLYNLAKNDGDVDSLFISNLSNLKKNNDFYFALVECFKFAILEKRQPITESILRKEVIESVLSDTSISSVSLQEYLSLKLREGINYDYHLKRLSLAGNAYAAYEFGSNEYYGFYKGYPRYDEAYKYLKIAADLNHAGASYMIGTMYLKGMLGNQSNDDYECAYRYFEKAYELGNVAACNSIGNMYYEGLYPLEKDVDKAILYYEKAANDEYVYAFNNLGKIAEYNNDFNKAFEYYKKSADMGESWACNKVGDFYRLGLIDKDLKLAFEYYNKALDSNYHTLRYYAYYNLAKYFYLDGCPEVVLLKDRDKALEYLKIASNNGVIDAIIMLFYLKVEDYIKYKSNNIYDEILDLKNVIETNIFDKEVLDSINKELKKISNVCRIDLNFLKDDEF